MARETIAEKADVRKEDEVVIETCLLYTSDAADE